MNVRPFLIVLPLLFTFAAAPDKPGSGLLQTRINQFKKLHDSLPEDRLYVQCDKPFYQPGDTIWFSAFVRDARTFKPSGKSDIIHAELLNPKGSVEKQLLMIAKSGCAPGDFTLGEEAPGGIYSLKVYTSWQQNDPDPAFFVKELQVQDAVLPRLKMKLDFTKKAYGSGDKVTAEVVFETNENKPLSDYPLNYTVNIGGNSILSQAATLDKKGKATISFTLPRKLESSDGLLLVNLDYDGQAESISRSIPIVLNKIALSFFPEGGDLVSGIESHVAFKAVNEFGKGADIDGYVEDDKGKKAAQFSSLHLGMGGFTFTPEEGVAYKAHITRPGGVAEVYLLPEAMPQGYVLSVKSVSRETMELSIGSTRSETVNLLVQVRGQLYYSKSHEVKNGNTPVKIDLSTFPQGVAQVTLVDNKDIERAERLVYVNKHRNANVTVKTDKERYLPREKVTLTITASDETGMRMPGHFALAVTDDQLLSFADDKSSTILSWMFAEADVKGKIEEPRFYFDSRNDKAEKALNYLLLTHGWRRFTWQQIKTEGVQNVRYPSERTIIKGTVKFAETGKPAARATVKIVEDGISTVTDSAGYFTINNVELYGTKTAEAVKGALRTTATVSNYQNEIELFLGMQVKMLMGADDDMVFPMAAAAAPEMAPPPRPVPRNGIRHHANKVIKNKVFDVNKAARGQNIERELAMLAAAEQKNEKAVMPKPVLAKRMAAPVMMKEAMADEVMAVPPLEPAPEVSYYRARQFAFPDYKERKQDEKRTDFRSTIFWKGDITLKNNGTTTVTFFTNDAITSFRAVSEGFTDDGGAARGETVFYSQKPFSLSVKVPPEVLTGDTLELQALVKNSSRTAIKGTFSAVIPDGMQLIGTSSTSIEIASSTSASIPIRLAVIKGYDSSALSLAFQSNEVIDEVTLPVKVQPQGFPVELSFSGSGMSAMYDVSIVNNVPNSVRARLTAFPSAISDLLSGIDAILQEPYGCFEQTSMTSYPNALVLSYLKTSESKDTGLIARASALLDRGYKRLVTFETKEKGYEWFGQQPGHEALSAYGLMQFADIVKAGGNVDKTMIDRTSEWLLRRRDGNGGFLKNPRALDSYGGADPDITNAYIVYALAEAGRRDLQKELDASVAYAKKSGDPYVAGLVANALYCYEDRQRGDDVLKIALDKQAADGSWCGLKHSITRSEGVSLKIETTSLVALAVIKHSKPDMSKLTSGIKYLVASRSGGGAFGSTQSTIMALKALTAYAQFARKTDAPGTIVIAVNGKDVLRKSYTAGEQNAIILDSLETFLKDDSQKLAVRFEGTKSPLPHSLLLQYHTWKPQNAEACKVQLSTTASASNVKVGQTVRISAKLKNNTDAGQPMTMMIIGLPAGVSPQPWQLKEIQEKKMADFYETKGTSVIFYYRQLKPLEEKIITLDCKAEVPGLYAAPASRAYLYYTNEHKVWSDLPKLTVVR